MRTGNGSPFGAQKLSSDISLQYDTSTADQLLLPAHLNMTAAEDAVNGVIDQIVLSDMNRCYLHSMFASWLLYLLRFS